jgi:hypothetical protein
MNFQILTFKLKTLPLDLPQPYTEEGSWIAICLNPIPTVNNNSGTVRKEEVIAYGFNKEQAIENLKEAIAELLYDCVYVEQVETSILSM